LFFSCGIFYVWAAVAALVSVEWSYRSLLNLVFGVITAVFGGWVIYVSVRSGSARVLKGAHPPE
jgi:hypothetical protein